VPSYGISARDLEILRGFSPAAARWLESHPSLARFLARPPRLDALARVPLVPERVRKAVRLLRGRVFVHTAHAERLGRSPLETGRLWSDAADAAIALCARCAAREVEARFGASGMGRAVFALGKLGSRELNPSSDVDLLVAYARDGEVPSGKTSAHEWHLQWVRKLRALLHDVDEDGFAFRVDLDLRPEGTQGPLVNSVDALESYYERFGQTWERAALLRLRAVHDVDGVGAEVMRRVRPFVFPRSVDAKAVDELFAMKTRVTASASSDGFDVKRGRGGIREVEFVVQANQMLHGGKLAGLRTGNIVELLDKLEEHGLVPHKTALELTQGYVLLRRIEHALQYGEDRQTQTLPEAGSAEHERVAHAILDVMGRRASFDDLLAQKRALVHEAFERVLGENREAPNEHARRALDRTLPPEVRTAALASLGFGDAARALDLVHLLERRRGSPLAPVEAKASDALDAGAHLIESVARSPDPMAALARLPDLFLERVPRAAINAITHDKRTLALATRLLATSAPLSRMLSKHHGLDEILARGLATPRLRKADVRAEVDAETASHPQRGVDEEARLVAMRRAHSRRTLAIALAFFGARVDAPGAGLALSTLADALLDEAVALAHAKIHARHGAIEGATFAVIGLGSLGGRELGFFRDLDLLFVYEGDASLESSGPKRIGIGEHAARTAQQVIWAVAAPLAEGACYAVDSRLRPSGGQGALTTSLATFASYHERESAPWERQALLRARFVAGDRALGARAVAAAKRAAFRVPEAGLGARLLDMRARMVNERAAHVGLDLKMGEGGLADVEFAVQGLQLAHGHHDPLVWSQSTRRALGRLARRGHLNVQWARDLERAWRELSRAREALALVDDKREPSVSPSDARLDMLVRAGVLEGTSGVEAYDRLAKAAATVRDLTARILVRLG
jgi:glutamate-ammonia-ligase adenylyltransferase